MLLPLQVVAVASLWAYSSGNSLITQLAASITKRKGNTAFFECQVETSVLKKNRFIHWYQQKPGRPLERILYISSNENIFYEKGISEERFEARKRQDGSAASLRVHRVAEADAGTYYCACWDSSGWIKVFGQGTKLIVISPDNTPKGDLSPKPTVFLPSIAETHLHKAGTYLCLLEDFFPDAIKVYWKAKDGNTILESHQGNTVKTNDKYMKVSWLTVNGKSMDEEHKCVVRHENNKGGGDQEILFPSINKGVMPTSSTAACLKDKQDVLQQQLWNTSAYYTYLLLLLKSSVYFVIIVFCLRKTGVCSHGKTL